MNDVNAWLERAANWRMASLLFSEPHADRAAELTELAALVSEPARAGAAALAADTALRGDDYYPVLGPGGCPATESAYDRAAIANRGPLIADVAAFYEAFVYPPRFTCGLAPDHVAVELDFLGFLALKVAFALDQNRQEESVVGRAAYREFLDAHPGFWIDQLVARLESTGHAPFAGAARWVSAILERERAGLGATEVPCA
jgi:TorA maturation chaperone TorD